MPPQILNSFNAKASLTVGTKKYTYYSLPRLAKAGFKVNELPYSLKILLENLLRHEDGVNVTKKDIKALCRWNPKARSEAEIAFTPARVILQDFTGVPAVADLAAMRDAVSALGGDAQRINPLFPAELVIDHSVQVDFYGTADALERNAAKEFERNQERYLFLRWGQNAFKDFKVIPPATGIVHQVNIEYLARVAFEGIMEGTGTVYPDTVVGTDSHTTMVNGLGVLGWGVGGIEAEAAMLGQAIPLLIPQVVGVKFVGRLPEGATATDLVLTVTQKLREKGVVGKFVEFYGPGIAELTVADRATLSNMAPEFGSTCAIFPIDDETIRYLKMTGRPASAIRLIETYAKKQGLYWTPKTRDAKYSDTLTIDLSAVKPCLAGPRRPQDRIELDQSKIQFGKDLEKQLGPAAPTDIKKSVAVTMDRDSFNLRHGSVTIAAITSCTNTSNPSVLMAAGLLAQKARKRGLEVKPWVKTSLAPGSQVVTAYLKQSGLLKSLEELKFHVVGYGCTTCIGNSGPLPPDISTAVSENHLVACAVLSGNRNFEGRINPDVRFNYLASPPLVVAYALSGRMDWDPYKEPIGQDKKGKDVYLKDIWPTSREIAACVRQTVKASLFKTTYASIDQGPAAWRALQSPMGDRYAWDPASTYIQKPPFVSDLPRTPFPRKDIHKARVLAVLGDSVTTDHISPAGSIKADSPAGKYLLSHGVTQEDFNSYGARRGNHEVMVRGTFANIRLKNALADGKEGGYTKYLPAGLLTTIYDASVAYQKAGVPLLIIAGKEYGSGSSRDWAAKGPKLLGIDAVIAESFERIHRSNLIGMGILPLQFKPGETAATLGLMGYEMYSIEGIEEGLKPGKVIKVSARLDNGNMTSFEAITRIDTPVELEYYKHGGIMPYVLRQLLS